VWTVVGLGNPGREYADTRHNLGFRVVDELVRRSGARPTRGLGDYVAAPFRLGGLEALLVKPTTYVNRTGRAVLQLVEQRGTEPGTLLALVDDVYLQFGRLRLRPRGGAGGHNGLRSMIDALATEEFPRLRLGVGSPDDDTPLPDWVLGSFGLEEARELPGFLARAADAVLRVLEIGVEAALPHINAPPPEEPGQPHQAT
jgi:peptidyl-tRNA hydrolase, PTH1 family